MWPAPSSSSSNLGSSCFRFCKNNCIGTGRELEQAIVKEQAESYWDHHQQYFRLSDISLNFHYGGSSKNTWIFWMMHIYALSYGSRGKLNIDYVLWKENLPKSNRLNIHDRVWRIYSNIQTKINWRKQIWYNFRDNSRAFIWGRLCTN